MLSVPKALTSYAYGGSTLSRSRALSAGTMITALVLILLAGVQVVVEIPSVAKLFRLPEEIIIHIPPKKKEFEILFASNTNFIYEIEIEKPVVEPPKKEPEPIPEPPKPKPKPPPPVPAPVPKVIPEVKPVVTAPAGPPQGEPSGASGDQLLGELLAYVNKYKVYPRAAQRRGIQGINYISVTIAPSGKITGAELARGMGNTTLDNASKKLAEKITSLQLSAPNKPLKVTVPIQYMFTD